MPQKIITEKALEKKLKTEVEKKNGVAFKFVSPGRDGVTDRIVIAPPGKLWFVEMKRPGQTLRPLQQVFKSLIESKGFQHRVIDSTESLANFLNEI